MRHIKTLDEVIRPLRVRGDARLDKWEKIKLWISEGQYTKVWDKIRGDVYDSDYTEAVAIVSKAIAEHYQSEGQSRDAAEEAAERHANEFLDREQW